MKDDNYAEIREAIRQITVMIVKENSRHEENMRPLHAQLIYLQSLLPREPIIVDWSKLTPSIQKEIREKLFNNGVVND